MVPESELVPTKEHVIATKLITELLENYHYKPVKLNDGLSSLIFERYINALDPMKIYFTKEDIIEFEQHKNKVDDYLNKASLMPLFEIFSKFRAKLIIRAENAISIVKNVILILN